MRKIVVKQEKVQACTEKTESDSVWYVRTATSNSLKALSHSFCPAACWVQSVISWLILSVTALKHTGSHTASLALACVLCMHAQAGFTHTCF